MKRTILILIAFFISISVFSADPPKPVDISNIGPLTVAKYKAKLGYETKTEAEAKYVQKTDASIYQSPTTIEMDSVTYRSKLKFIVGLSGGALNKAGDSIILDDRFIGKTITVYRDGLKLYQNLTGVINPVTGYRFNASTGQIIFRPVLATNNKIEIISENKPYFELGLPQNLLSVSEEISSAYYTKVGLTASVAGQGLDLDGNNTLSLITIAATNNYLSFTDAYSMRLTVIPQKNYYLSFDVKRGTGMTSFQAVALDYTHGNDGIVGQFFTMTDDLVHRYTFPFVTPVGCTKVELIMLSSFNAVGTCYISRAQVTDEPSLTYVKTVGTPKP